MTTVTAQIAQDMLLVTAYTALLLTFITSLLGSIPAVRQMPNSAYDSLVHGIGIALNFGLLIGMLASQGHLDLGTYWYLYLGAAGLQQGGSAAAYARFKSVVSSKLAASGGVVSAPAAPVPVLAGPAAGVKAGVVLPDPAAPAIVPVAVAPEVAPAPVVAQ